MNRISTDINHAMSLCNNCRDTLVIGFAMLSFFVCTSTFGDLEIETINSLRRYDPTLSNACGPVNLFLALRLMNVKVNIHDVMEKCDVDENGTSDFSKIAVAAKSFGIFATPVKMNIKALKDTNHLVLLQINKPKGHFVLFNKKQERYELLDATGIDEVVRTEIKLSELDKLWNGYAIILSEFPISLYLQCPKRKIIFYSTFFGIFVGLGLIASIHLTKFI